MKNILLFSAIILLTALKANAQTYGCTDKNAKNYNSAATNNDGSCEYKSKSASVLSSLEMPSNVIETSGLTAWNNLFWTHNDSNDKNIYALDANSGNIIQTIPINSASNFDWEEISQDSNYFYIGDFGNNGNGNRTDLKIFKISKSSILGSSPIVETIKFSYSNQTDFNPTGSNNTDFDCEAFIVSKDSIFIFTKQWKSKGTNVYSLPKTAGTFIANLKTTYNVDGLITGATYIESQNKIVLCGYSKCLKPFLYLLYDFNSTNFFSGNKRKVNLCLPFKQVEGIATADGLTYYITNEKFSKFIISTKQKLRKIDLTEFFVK